MAELPINTTGRKNLIVGEVKDKKKVGEAEVMDFFAKIEGEENSTKYGVWSKAGNPSKLEALVKTGTTIDCDVEVKTSEKKDDDGNHYRSRKVTNIYQDGKAVKSEQQGKAWGKSPETTAMELDSKARNTALMQACEFVDSPDATVEDVLSCADRFYAWLKGEKTTPHKETVQPAKQEAPLPIVATAGTTAEQWRIPLGWLKDTMGEVNWNNKKLVDWIHVQFPQTDISGSLTQVINRLDINQTNMLRNHLAELKELK